MAGAAGSDRRSHPRAQVDLGVSISAGDSPWQAVTPVNISASGIYCISGRRLGELSRLEILLKLDQGVSIQARAVVIREEALPDGTFGLGLFFTGMADEHRALIAELVSGAAKGSSR